MSAFTTLRQWGGSLARVPQSRFGWLKSSPFVRNVGILSSGTAIGHLFTLAAAPLLTRMYQPRDFGALALFTSYFSVMGVAVCLQYEVSIPSGRDDAEAAYLTLASLVLTLPVSVVAGVILWLLIHFSALGYGSAPWHMPLLLTLTVCFFGIFAALRYWCLRKERFAQVSQGTLVQAAGRALLQAIFGAAGFHSAGLLVGETLGRGMGMSRMFRFAWPVLRDHARRFRWLDCKAVLWRNRKFPLYSLPASFLDALCLSLPVPLLIRLYGASIGGHYSLVWRAIALPGVLITAAIADTFHSHMASCARETPDKVTALFSKTSLGLLLLGSIPTAILWFWGAPLFRMAFGAEWALSGAIAAIIAPWYLSDFIVSPVSRVVFVLSGQEMKLIWDVLCLVALVAVFVVAELRNMEVLQTIRILTVVSVAIRAVYYVLLLRIIMRFRERHNPQVQAA
jgi:lipopolysaccharide exporter